ncbi:MAG: hypothetical protein ACOCYW_05370 [Roseicyclus sp.]
MTHEGQAGDRPAEQRAGWGGIERDRWRLLEAILEDRRLTPGAKIVATSLLTRYASKSNRRVRVVDQSVAAAVAMRVDTVYRHLRSLVDAGFLVTLERRRGGGLYEFARVMHRRANVVSIAIEAGCSSGNDSTEHGCSSGMPAANPDRHPGNPDEHPAPPTPPYKDTQGLPRKMAMDASRGPIGIVLGQGDADRRREWDQFLVGHGLPVLDQIAEKGRQGDVSGCIVPSRFPPSADRQEAVDVAVAFFSERRRA